MEVANEILAQMDEQLPLVEPVVRHGNPPTFIQTEFFLVLSKSHRYLIAFVPMGISLSL